MPDDLLQRLRHADPLAGDAPTPPSLDALGLTADRLTADGAAPAGPTPTPARQRAPWRATGLSVVVALLVGTGTAAASLTALTGDPLGRTPQVDIEPAASTVRIAAARSADPDGGPDWGVRVGSAERGLVCVAVGQVRNGQLGLVGLDGTFRPDRPRGADDCVVTGPDRIVVQGRTFLGQHEAERRVSVIYGVAGPTIERVHVEYPDRVGPSAIQTIPIDRSGTFVLAQRGSLRQRSPRFYALFKQKPGATYSSMTTVDFGRPWTRAQIQAKQRYSWPAGRAKFAEGTTPGGVR